MDIDEINTHIHKLKCGSTDWQSVEKLAALCTVRDELEEAHTPETQSQAFPPTDYRAAYSTGSGTAKRLCGGCQLCAIWRSDAGA